MYEHTGGCHCGNLRYRYLSSHDAATLPLRQCGCSYCRRTGARYSADPAGALHLAIGDAQAVTRHQFASKAVEFLLCRHCGVLTAALTRVDDTLLAVINANTLDHAATGACTTSDFSAETEEQGRQRRRRTWIADVTLSHGA